jgi:DNA-binding transcriptional LysR family regulator
MNIRQMEVFRAVMQMGSVTAAAKLLNVSQPAVSAVLRHCEDQLKSKLFLRVGRRLRPTPEAEMLFPEVDSAFRRMELVTRLAQDLIAGTRGTIAVAATHSSAPLVASCIPRFLSPGGRDIRISLQSLPSAEVVDRVLSHEVDLGVAYGPVLHAGIEAELLVERKVVCVLPRSHALVTQRSISVANLVQTRVITYGTQTALGKIVQAELLKAGGDQNQLIEVNSTDLACMLVAAGAGVGVIDPSPTNVRFENLVKRPLAIKILVQLFMVFARGRPLSKLTKDFAQQLSNRAARRSRD